MIDSTEYTDFRLGEADLIEKAKKAESFLVGFIFTES